MLEAARELLPLAVLKESLQNLGSLGLEHPKIIIFSLIKGAIMIGTAQCFEAIERAAAELGLLPEDYMRCDSNILQDEPGILAVSFYGDSSTLLGAIEVPLEEAPE
jgi:hypothetical protein